MFKNELASELNVFVFAHSDGGVHDNRIRWAMRP